MIRHLVVVIGALVLSYTAWAIDFAIRQHTARTFQTNLYLFLIPFLIPVAVAAALGFLLAAPAWWPRRGAGRPRRVAWGILALYALPGLLLATFFFLYYVFPPPRLSRLTLEYLLHLGTRTLGGILIGYGVGQAIAPPQDP